MFNKTYKITNIHHINLLTPFSPIRLSLANSLQNLVIPYIKQCIMLNSFSDSHCMLFCIGIFVISVLEQTIRKNAHVIYKLIKINMNKVGIIFAFFS